MMKKKSQNILFLLLGFLCISIAIFPTIYFYIIYLNKSNSYDYYFFRCYTFYVLIFFTFVFFLLGFIFIIPGLNLFLHTKLIKPFSFNRCCYILVLVSLIEFFLMNFLFPHGFTTVSPPT